MVKFLLYSENMTSSSVSCIKIGIVGLRGINWEGGIESYCNYIYPNFPINNDELIFYTRRRYGIETRWKRFKVSPCPAITSNGVETLSYAVIAYWRALLIDRVDVLHIHAIGAGLLVPFARIAGVGTVVRHVGTDWNRPKWGKLGRLVLRTAEWIVGRFADVVTCLDETAAREFRERTGARAKIMVIGNAVCSATPKDTPLPAGLTPHGYVLSASRIAEEKGILELIEAYRRSGLNERGISLAIAGEVFGGGHFKRDVRERAAEISGCVLLGRQDRATVAGLMVDARAYVSTSSHEGMSFSTLEALAGGCPCLLSDIRENRLIGRSFAQYYPVHDTAALTAALTKMCDTPPDPAALDSQRREIRALHDVGNAARRTRAALETAHRLARSGANTTPPALTPRRNDP